MYYHYGKWKLGITTCPLFRGCPLFRESGSTVHHKLSLQLICMSYLPPPPPPFPPSPLPLPLPPSPSLPSHSLLLPLGDNDVVCEHEQVKRLLLDLQFPQQLLFHLQADQCPSPLQLPTQRHEGEGFQLPKFQLPMDLMELLRAVHLTSTIVAGRHQLQGVRLCHMVCDMQTACMYVRIA